MKIPSNRDDDNSFAEKRKSLHLLYQDFEGRFPTDEDCLEELVRRIEAGRQICCRACGSEEISRAFGARYGFCLACGGKYRPTAGTFFEGAKLLKVWLFLLELFEKGLVYSVSLLHEVIGAAASTLAEMMNKFKLVICQAQREDNRIVEVHSRPFSSIYFRRSVLTAQKKHPVTEQADIEREHLKEGAKGVGAAAATSNVAQVIPAEPDFLGEMSANERRLLPMVSDTPVQFEILREKSGIKINELSSALMRLQLRGMVSKEPGDKYVLATPVSSPPIANGAGSAADGGAELAESQAKNIEAFIDFVREHFGGIARRYLELYQAIYWCKVDRERWGLDAVFRQCMKFGAVPSSALQAFVTPLFVKVAPLPQ